MTKSSAVAASLSSCVYLAIIAYAPRAPAQAAAPSSQPAQPPATSPTSTTSSTLAAAPSYRGWVQIDPGSPLDGPSAINTITGAVIYHNRPAEEAYLIYRNPATGEDSDYYFSTNLVRIGTLSPDHKERLIENAAELPLNLVAAAARRSARF